METIESFVYSTGGKVAVGALAAVLFLALIGILHKKASTRVLVCSAMLIALATALSFVGYSFPFGGSITLFSMFFIILSGLWFGLPTGLVVGLTYGLLQFAIKPYFYHPIQVFFDYILAFGALGLSGLFKDKKHGMYSGIIVAMLGRLLFSSISGYVFFAENTWDGWDPILYTIVYNGGYIVPEMIITLALVSLPQMRHALEKVKTLVSE